MSRRSTSTATAAAASGLAVSAESRHGRGVRKELFITGIAIVGALAWKVGAQELGAQPDQTPDQTANPAPEPAPVQDPGAGPGQGTTPGSDIPDEVPPAPDEVPPVPDTPVARHMSQRPAMSAGAALYDRFCLACHGVHGDGKGPGSPWLWPRPRDFTRGEYKWRSTPTGVPPTDDDLAAAIIHGVPGTSMHGFGQTLDEGQITSLIAYVKDFAPEAFSAPGTPLIIPEPPEVNDALIAQGKAAYGRLGCAACHGEDGKGQGPAASALRDADGNPAPPYDLTTQLVRRPGGDDLKGIYTSLLTGLTGTAMPAFAGQVPDDDLWAVAAYVDTIRYRLPDGVSPADAPRTTASPVAVHPTADNIDREKKLARGGYWPGHGLPEETALFGTTIMLQGEPPASLGPAQASLSSRQCARCHAKQVREWQSTLHAGAASPGLLGQFHNSTPAFVEDCQRCHNPLAEQLPRIRTEPINASGGKANFVANPRYDKGLQHEGINCAACHVRGHQRHGPPLIPDAKLLALPGYPVKEMRIYERADFCMTCHQLPPRFALEGKPLLNTYREWLEGPYMRRGVQCQHCHMPDREHTWKGIHDPETFRQGYDLEAIAGRSEKTGAVSVRARMVNVGAGHYLPTTPTPAAWLSIQLVDRRGRKIRGAYAEQRIGRHLDFVKGFVEVEDTRIPPGESREIAAAWKGRDVDRATAVKVTVRVEPDEYYERFFTTLLKGRRTKEARAQLEEALERTRESHYVAEERLFPIP